MEENIEIKLISESRVLTTVNPNSILYFSLSENSERYGIREREKQ